MKKIGFVYLYFVIINRHLYYVDNKHIKLEVTNDEKNSAKVLSDLFGFRVYHIPKIDFPQNIKTADYYINGEYWDLKCVNGYSKSTFDNLLKTSKYQSCNFIIDISKTNLSANEILRQLYFIYESYYRIWINKIIIKSGCFVLFIIKRPTAAQVGHDWSLDSLYHYNL